MSGRVQLATMIEAAGLIPSTASLVQSIANGTATGLVNFQGRHIGDLGLEAVILALKHRNFVEWLDLTENDITSEGVRALVTALTNNPTLHTLTLTNNTLDDAAAESLANLVETNTVVNAISVYDNPNISRAGINRLRAAANARDNFTLGVDDPDETTHTRHVLRRHNHNTTGNTQAHDDDDDDDDDADEDVLHEAQTPMSSRVSRTSMSSLRTPDASGGAPAFTLPRHRQPPPQHQQHQHQQQQATADPTVVNQLLDQQHRMQELLDERDATIATMRVQLEEQEAAQTQAAAALISEKEQLQATIAELTQTNEQRAEECDQANERKAELAQRLQTAIDELESLRSAHADSEQQQTDLTERIKAMKEEMEDLQQAKDDVEQSKADLETRLATQLETLKTQHEQKVKDLGEANEALQTQRNTLQQQNESNAQALRDARAEIERLQQALQEPTTSDSEDAGATSAKPPPGPDTPTSLQEAEAKLEGMLNLNMDLARFTTRERVVDDKGDFTKGGYGKLYRCTIAGHDVALKEIDVRSRPRLLEILSEKSNTQAHANDKRVRREVAILMTLRHPNIVSFYGICYDAERKTLSFVLSWADNGSLFDFMHLHKRQISHVDKLRILSEVAGAMEFLHAHDVVHRDLKSANVLLDAVLSAKVTDFGLSTFKNTETSSLSRVAGTPLWASPEQVLEEKLRADTDAFSFGCLAWEVWFAVKPWHHGKYEKDGISLLQLALKYEKHEYLPLEKVINGQEMPVHLRALLRGCFTTSGSRLSFALLHAAFRGQYAAAREQRQLNEARQQELLQGPPDAVWKFDPEILATLKEKKHALSTRDTVYVVPLDLGNQDEASLVKTLLRQAGGRTARQPDLLGPFGRKVAAAVITWCDQKLAAFNGAMHRNKTRFRGHLTSTSHPFAPKYEVDDTGAATNAEEKAVLDRVTTKTGHYRLLDASLMKQDPPLRVQRVFHGVNSFDAVVGILGGDFAPLQKTDIGWFGAGPYFTPDLDYALEYAHDCDGADVPADLRFLQLTPGEVYRIVLVCDVTYGNPYPVTKNSLHPMVQSTAEDKLPTERWQTFAGLPLVAGHDAHIAVTAFDSKSVDYVPPFDTHADWSQPGEKPVAELVISDTSCALVRAVCVFQG
ncbi:serine/threonine protein kinase [Salpingoeca rosetta]|uniref:Serine/threonine protein kinase n=1 Tax=Salpingoeca rosetta (strain ATCC 50818 / BSB-021) TaxID=946362 RepID=F2U8P4_SALR5|nr:serine/threonine protein kinase [Salpingoeca rosetta]EGD72752.1 serine/threonine protein kinase [Salpingoeca rosetta]|eukprot:XP_004994575.1 serine/threonine protein kinase [Salpingoeca rosetta]